MSHRHHIRWITIAAGLYFLTLAPATQAGRPVTRREPTPPPASLPEALTTQANACFAVAEAANAVLVAQRAVDQNNYDVLDGIRTDGLSAARQINLLRVLHDAYAGRRAPTRDQALAVLGYCAYVRLNLETMADQRAQMPASTFVTLNGTATLIHEREQAARATLAVVQRLVDGLQQTHGVTLQSVLALATDDSTLFGGVAGLRSAPASAAQADFLTAIPVRARDAARILQAGNACYESLYGYTSKRLDRGVLINCSGQIGVAQDYQLALTALACLEASPSAALADVAITEMNGRAELLDGHLALRLEPSVVTHVRDVQTWLWRSARDVAAYGAGAR